MPASPASRSSPRVLLRAPKTSLARQSGRCEPSQLPLGSAVMPSTYNYSGTGESVENLFLFLIRFFPGKGIRTAACLNAGRDNPIRKFRLVEEAVVKTCKGT